MKNIIYAASDVTFIELDPAKFRTPPATFTRCGKVYRRLTPEYWAWFHHKYALAEHALARGKMKEATFVEILSRIAKLYNVAFATFGKETLDAAVRNTDVREQDRLIKTSLINRKETPSMTPQAGKAACGTHLRGSPPSLVAERGKNGRG